jgi:hypothetical protein
MVAALTLALALSLTACKSSKPATPVDDATLTSAVQSRLAGDGAISTEAIQSSVKDGIATLNGTVSNEAARSLAAADAAQVDGIRTVVNNLSVQQPPPPAVAAITPPPPIPTAPKKTPIPRVKAAPVVHPPSPPETTAQEVSPPPQPAAPMPPPPPSPPPPAAPPAPAFHNITLPPDTVIPIRITQTLDSATTQQGDSFSGTIATDVFSDDMVVLRQGTPVTGRVSAVQEAAHYKGNSLLTIELTSIERRNEKLPITTDPYSVQGKGRGKNTAAKVGGGAAVGAVLGGIFGGGKGAAIGAATGGGVGAAANTITRGEQVQIPSETLIRFHLNSPFALRVSTNNTESPASTPDLQPRSESPRPQ